MKQRQLLRKRQEAPLYIVQDDPRFGKEPLRKRERPPLPCVRRKIGRRYPQSACDHRQDEADRIKPANFHVGRSVARPESKNRPFHNCCIQRKQQRRFLAQGAKNSENDQTGCASGKPAPRRLHPDAAGNIKQKPGQHEYLCQALHPLHDVSDSGEIDRRKQPRTTYEQSEPIRRRAANACHFASADDASRQQENEPSIRQMYSQIHSSHRRWAWRKIPVQCETEHCQRSSELTGGR